MNKKAGLSVVMTIILIIFSAIVVFGVTARFVNLMSQETQQSICSANVIVGNKVLEGGKDLHWTLGGIKDKSAHGALQTPLCTTIVNRIEAYDKDESKNKEIVAIEIGEMVENCWDTFGEGKYVNTFGQGTTRLIYRDLHNYYFPCYKFRIDSGNLDKISVSELVEFSENSNLGLLWKYNLQGQKIDATLLESVTKYNEGDTKYLSYAGYVFNGGDGYLEFMEEVSSTVRWGDWVAGILILGPVFGTIGRLREGTSNMAVSDGTHMDELFPNVWYEVRYYSPFIIDPDKHKESFIINNIKITPADEDGAGREIANIGLS